MGSKQMKIDFAVIAHQSDDYEQMCRLRDKILRQPIGLRLTEQDCLRDAHDILLAGKIDNTVIACCILTPIDDHTVKLRQMAVDDACQNQGVGRQMLAFAEQIAHERNFSRVMMHARKTALGFYAKYGYIIEGEEFEEVGIAHYVMVN